MMIIRMRRILLDNEPYLLKAALIQEQKGDKYYYLSLRQWIDCVVTTVTDYCYVSKDAAIQQNNRKRIMWLLTTNSSLDK